MGTQACLRKAEASLAALQSMGETPMPLIENILCLVYGVVM
jgi:hypothetical protein